jgi:hypothetical protein
MDLLGLCGEFFVELVRGIRHYAFLSSAGPVWPSRGRHTLTSVKLEGQSRERREKRRGQDCLGCAADLCPAQRTQAAK